MMGDVMIYSVCPNGRFNWFAVGYYLEAIGIKGFPVPSYRVICKRK